MKLNKVNSSIWKFADNKISVADFLKKADKDLTVVDFKRYTLRAE